MKTYKIFYNASFFDADERFLYVADGIICWQNELDLDSIRLDIETHNHDMHDDQVESCVFNTLNVLEIN